jgi:hypothetical protein
MKGFLIKNKILYRKGFIIKTYLTNKIHIVLEFTNSKILIKLKA